ncbi:MAG TPA: enolase C-terminal domain-like protein [Burkholderiales bacterium]|nr:enolase C-terminal domain-like protein [Burkholderiales bacterium]
MSAPRFALEAIDLFERQTRLRMPFRFGVATLTAAPQAFVRARIRLADGRRSVGAAAEMMAPKWFDKNPALSDEENVEQLRASLALARSAYLAGDENTAGGHWQDNYAPQIARGAQLGLNGLTACYGPALIDRALLDALCRALGVSFWRAMSANLPGIEAPGLDMTAFLSGLAPQATIAARHTVGLADPIAAGDLLQRVNDGLPETLEEVVARYGQRWFKLKVDGDPGAAVERLAAIAAVLDRIEAPYHATLDCNEQYADVEGALELWRRVAADPRLARLARSVLFVEQPIRRADALARDISPLARRIPVIIDESDDSLEAFPQARTLGYTGVSSKTCKGLYKSLINAARCMAWNRAQRAQRYFMSGEDLTVQAGLALQQDLALVSLLGIRHVERNGHHYVNGMAAAPEREQSAFLAAHPDLYESSHGAVRASIRAGNMAIASLDCPGYASGAMPDWSALGKMQIRE